MGMGIENRPDAEVSGLPSLNLDDMMGIQFSPDFSFNAVFGDIVMCEVIDENEFGEILRGAIWVKMEISNKLWRRGKVVLKGPKCTELEIGDEVCYPSDRGIPMISGKKKFVFLNMERLFGKLNPIPNAKV